MVNWFCVMTSGDDRICPNARGIRKKASTKLLPFLDGYLSLIAKKMMLMIWLQHSEKNAPQTKHWKQMDLEQLWQLTGDGDCDWRWGWRHLQNYESSASKVELDVAH